MKNKDFKKEILRKIEDKNIEPKPKWRFLLKNYIILSSGFFFVFVGAISISVIIFTLVNGDWGLYRFLRSSFLEPAIKTIPFFWILFLFLFILLADYNFKNTKKGYRYGIIKIVGSIVLGSFILGGLFYQLGLAHITDYELGRYMPGYKMFTEKRQLLWNKPSEGILIGTLLPSEKSNALVLKDFNNKEWEVVIDKLAPMHFIILDNADKVVFIGNLIEENIFEACDVKPWLIKGESVYLYNKMHNQMMRRSSVSSFGMNNMMVQFRNNNLDERKIFNLRNNMCEGRILEISDFTKPRY